MPIEYRLPVASAQVKSAILLAGLNTAGRDHGDRAGATRDHTETMLRHFGAEVRVADEPGGGNAHHPGRPARAGGARCRRAGRPVVGGLRCWSPARSCRARA
jgi:3-phosphoshikimate 1-carboxyvinyltransferase